MNKGSSINKIAYLVCIISLIFIPINFDALIIPKEILLFISALYLLANLGLNIKILFMNPYRKFLIIALLITLQMLIVMFKSTSPFEQEFFGRTGRGLGFSTFFALLVFLLFTTLHSKISDSKLILKWLAISGLISSIYALMQRLGLDIVDWNSRTNGIIGTLGNPNFQSSFTAMALLPMIIYAWTRSRKYRNILVIISALIFLITLYFTQSTQGYIGALVSILIFFLLFFWYKHRKFFYLLSASGLITGSFAVAGMLNIGPLSHFLYKVSVQSRGNFWRAAFEAANSNPLFGVGIDSFGDAFLIYRDRPKVEMTDNAHNYFLEFSATGGYPLAILYLIIVAFTFFSFLSLQKKLNRFDIHLTAIFSAWIVFILQAIISPASIVLLTWNVLISGYLIGTNIRFLGDKNNSEVKPSNISYKNRILASSLLLTGLLVMAPLFKSDYELKNAADSKDALALMKSLSSYPESTVKYNTFIQELLKSGLNPQALDMARKAIKFNSNAVSAWALVLVNPSAPLQERIQAKSEILRLDPMNTEVSNFKLD